MACYNDAFSDISSHVEFVRLTQLLELIKSVVGRYMAEFADYELSQQDISDVVGYSVILSTTIEKGL